MIEALHISESGLKATQTWIDSISNNVANLQTAGFKKATMQFSNIVRAPERTESGELVKADVQTGLGIKMSDSLTDFTAGRVQATNNQLDVAIQGNGFFEILQSDGSYAYTRLGRFRVNSEGALITQNGLPLSNDIRIPPDVDKLEIRSDGQILGRVGTSSEILELGQIMLARIAVPEAMTNIGGGLYTVTSESGEAMTYEPGAEGTGQLLQKHVEMSNVDLVEEMGSLMLAQRAYQLNARIIQTVDQVLETVNNLRR